MSEGIAFTLEKEKKFVHVIAFKVDDEGLFKLDQCFNALKVKGKRRSDKMRAFINRVYTLLEEHEKLSVQNSANSRRLKDYEKLAEKYERTEADKTQLKQELAKVTKEKDALMKAFSRLPENGPIVRPPLAYKGSTEYIAPTKSEAVTPTQAVQKHDAYPLKRWEKLAQPKDVSGLLWCPYAGDWLHLAKCDQCKIIRFKTYTDCQERRLKNPNDPLFTPTKPKPLGA